MMPEIHNKIWTRGACLVFGHPWHVYFARVTERAPSEATGVERMNFRYIVDIEPLRDALWHICRDAPRGGNRTAPPAPLGRRIDELPRGPALVELEAERRPSQTYLFAESEQWTRKPPFYAESLDLTVARFGTLLTDSQVPQLSGKSHHMLGLAGSEHDRQQRAGLLGRTPDWRFNAQH